MRTIANRYNVPMRAPLLIAAVVAACASSKETEPDKVVAKIEVELRLHEIGDSINIGVQQAANRIAAATEDRAHRRLAIVWQIRTHAATRRALSEPDPRWAFIDLWTMTLQTLHFFEKSDVFGEHQPIAIDASRALVQDLERRAKRILHHDQFTTIRANVMDFATENPVEVGTMRQTNTPLQAHHKGTTKFVEILKMPTQLFTIGGGVKDTAVAISEVASAADRAADIVEDLPLAIRWQVQLMMMDLDQSPTIEALLRDVERASASVEALTKTADGLPAKVQAELSKTLREVEQQQAELQKSLTAARGVVSEARATVAETRTVVQAADDALRGANDTVKEVKLATEALERAGKAWEPTFRELNALVNPGGGGSDDGEPKDKGGDDSASAEADSGGGGGGGGGFDIKDIAKGADGLTSAAIELRGLVKEVRDLIQAGELAQAASQANTAVASAADTIMWRAIIVIAAFFGLLLGYRFLRPG